MLLDLALDLERAGLELGDGLRRASSYVARAASSAAAAASSAASAAASFLASASGSGTTLRSGRPTGSRPPRAGAEVAANPSASGSATAAPAADSPTPVLDRCATSSPLRSALAQSGSSIAAVSVASTWSATDWVTLVPSDAGDARGPGR